VELELVGFEIFNEAAKSCKGSFRTVIPADLNLREISKLRQVVAGLGGLLQWRGLLRVDFIREIPSGKLWFLEANGNPGLGLHECITVSVTLAVGISQVGIVGWMIALALRISPILGGFDLQAAIPRLMDD
jgi:D-alanine-D-alanine ligase-like ATP-grasp enzyme